MLWPIASLQRQIVYGNIRKIIRDGKDCILHRRGKGKSLCEDDIITITHLYFHKSK